MNKSESKYFHTAARMDEAFLTLLDEKDFAYITVKEICKRALSAPADICRRMSTMCKKTWRVKNGIWNLLLRMNFLSLN
ncbi:hypothetical protein [Butyricicoccus sp.]|uniref:hypothetical protein n=1 Tax=Butyricicoccus sp. TaxID=2049021 RepID=UPI003D7DD8E9